MTTRAHKCYYHIETFLRSLTRGEHCRAGINWLDKLEREGGVRSRGRNWARPGERRSEEQIVVRYMSVRIQYGIVKTSDPVNLPVTFISHPGSTLTITVPSLLPRRPVHA